MIMKNPLVDYIRDTTILIILFFFVSLLPSPTHSFIYCVVLTTRVFSVVYRETFQKLELKDEEE